MTALHALPAAALLAGYRRRSFSPLEVARSLLAHVERWEPSLQATWSAQPERLLQEAAGSTQRWQRGEPAGALDGVPVTLKENIATAGMAVPLGSAATLLSPATADAPPAARLREAGALCWTKTTMPDFGMLSSSQSSFHALTRNPWALHLGPGGSSAGAGAAAAAGYGPLHLGTDIGGSIRLPAAWCGVVGFKPSHGRVPIHPPYIGRVAGPMARTVDDCALMMATLSLPDWRDATSLPPAALDWQATAPPGEQDPGLRGLRIGLLLEAGWGQAARPEVLAAVQSAALALERQGAVVQPLSPFTTEEMADGIHRFWRLRSWLDITALPPARQDRVLPFIRQWVAPAQGFDAAQAFHGFSQIGVLRDAAVTACEPFDAVLSPVAPGLAFDLRWAMPSNDPDRAMDHIGFTLPYNMSGQPAISVPWSSSAEGLPIGVQVAGRRHDDLGVLRLARWLERLRPPLPPWPEPPAPAASQPPVGI